MGMSGRPLTEAGDGGARSVAANERLTALAGALLLVLIGVELVSAASLRTFLSAYVFVGVLLAGPLAVKLASTGYRFVRYYARAPAFVRKGPPRPALRALGPFLVATAVVVVGSGIGLLATGPDRPGALLPLHNVGVLFFLPMFAIHVFAHIRPLPRLVADDWAEISAARAPGRGRRLGLNLVALSAGAVAAVLLLPAAAPWAPWIASEKLPAPLIVGTVLAALALLATRPLRWQ